MTMALQRAVAPAAATPAAGQFEGMEKSAAPSVEQKATADVAATTAIAKAAASAVSTNVAKPFEYVLRSLECALDPVNVGDLPRLKSGAGNIKDSDGVNYGTFVALELLSFHDSWTISPGSDDDESKDFVRYSLDGKTIDGTGESVDDYLQKLKEVDGYEKANKKRYLILAGIINDCDKAKEKISSIVQCSLAPQSAKTFNNYHMQRSVQVVRGTAVVEGSQQIKITAEGASMNGKDFTKLVVTGTL
jgi:hypothetical protein